MANDNNGARVKLTGLWWNEGQNGSYLRGKLGAATLWIFDNGFKREGSNDPDMIAYITNDKKKEGDDDGGRQGSGSQRSSGQARQRSMDDGVPSDSAPASPADPTDDIPF